MVSGRSQRLLPLTTAIPGSTLRSPLHLPPENPQHHWKRSTTHLKHLQGELRLRCTSCSTPHPQSHSDDTHKSKVSAGDRYFSSVQLFLNWLVLRKKKKKECKVFLYPGIFQGVPSRHLQKHSWARKATAGTLDILEVCCAEPAYASTTTGTRTKEKISDLANLKMCLEIAVVTTNSDGQLACLYSHNLLS